MREILLFAASLCAGIAFACFMNLKVRAGWLFEWLAVLLVIVAVWLS